MTGLFWTSEEAAAMARPARDSPLGARRELLNSSSILRNPSLEPIIVSRGGRSKNLNLESDRSLRTNRYYNDRAPYANTPRNMFDGDDLPRVHGDRSTRIHGHDSTRYYNYRHNPYPDHSVRRAEKKLTPVYYTTESQYIHPRTPSPDPRHAHHPLLGPNCCLVFLKLMQMAICLVIVVISRVGDSDLDLDITFTVFGVLCLLMSGVSFLIIFVRGHPVPGDCMHITMFLCYAITVPVLMCGVILAFVQGTKNDYVYAMGFMFLVTMLFFSLDVLLTCWALLLCICCAPPSWLTPAHSHFKVSPWSDRYDHDYYIDPHHHRRKNDIRPDERDRYLPQHPQSVREGYYYGAAKDGSYRKPANDGYYSAERTLPNMIRYPGY